MGSGLSKMRKQAQMFEEQMKKLQNELAEMRVEGVSSQELVKVTISGEKDVLDISINPETLSDGEGLQDLILEAFADAHKKLDEKSQGMGMGGLPF